MFARLASALHFSPSSLAAPRPCRQLVAVQPTPRASCMQMRVAVGFLGGSAQHLDNLDPDLFIDLLPQFILPTLFFLASLPILSTATLACLQYPPRRPIRSPPHLNPQPSQPNRTSPSQPNPSCLSAAARKSCSASSFSSVTAHVVKQVYSTFSRVDSSQSVLSSRCAGGSHCAVFTC